MTIPDFDADHRAAVDWARGLLADNRALILDTETTGIYGPVGIVQLAICDLEGNEVYSTYVQSDVPVSEGAFAVHGIAGKLLADAPLWPDVWHQVQGLMYERGYPPLIIYNATYDCGTIRQCCARARHACAAAGAGTVRDGDVRAVGRRMELSPLWLSLAAATSRGSLGTRRLQGYAGSDEKDGGRRSMKVGTKSVLIGAHCFFIHPFFVALAWWQLYGFPFDLRLWAAFIVHDLGYWGKPNMDGPEGESHVEWGAQLMARWFGAEWGDFCRYHSRFYAKRDRRPFSRLCVADKLAMALEPQWLYLPRVLASSEVWEYVSLAAGRSGTKYVFANIPTGTLKEWHRATSAYMRKWAYAHQDGRDDTWTPNPDKNEQSNYALERTTSRNWSDQ